MGWERKHMPKDVRRLLDTGWRKMLSAAWYMLVTSVADVYHGFLVGIGLCVAAMAAAALGVPVPWL